MPSDNPAPTGSEEGQPVDTVEAERDAGRRHIPRVAVGLGWSVTVLVCFGLAGLIWLLPPVRRRALA